MSKFDSRKDEVVYCKALDHSFLDEQMGSCSENGWWAGRIDGLYGFDYIVTEDDQGFVEVERFDTKPVGFPFAAKPVELRWVDLDCKLSEWYSDNGIEDADY